MQRPGVQLGIKAIAVSASNDQASDYQVCGL